MRPDLYLPTIKHPGALEKAAGGKTTVGQGFNPLRIGEYIPRAREALKEDQFGNDELQSPSHRGIHS